MPIRGLLFDLDGVFHVGDQLLPGAIETLKFLRANSVPFRIVTNTTTRSRTSLVERMRTLGLPLQVNDVITAPIAAALHLKSLNAPVAGSSSLPTREVNSANSKTTKLIPS